MLYGKAVWAEGLDLPQMLSRPRRRQSFRLLVAALALGVLAIAGEASFHSSSGPTYVVQPGDSLWRIAHAYHVTVSQLAATNGMLPTDVLLIGRRLTIPGSTGSGSAAASGGVRVVQPGDTLSNIAKSYGVSITQLASANGMSPGDLLLIGRHLTIPGQGSSSRSASSVASSSRPLASSTSSGSGSPSDAPPAADPNFCKTFTPQAGPRGVLPSLLTASPDRLSLRPLFVQWARYYGIRPELLEAIAWQESGWQQGVVSSASAVGIGQILPATAQFVSGQLVGENLNINSVNDNLRMSAAYLSYLGRREGGNLCRTVASYYEGAQNMQTYGVFDITEPYVASVEALIPEFE